MKRLFATLALAAVFAAPARAEDVVLYAAGSLSGAFGEVAATFTAATGVAVKAAFGPSGLMRERIEAGEGAHLLASADMGHPRRLVAEGRAEGVIRFTGNRLCAMAPPAVGLTADNLLDKALDPQLRLGTSTPKADPAGDYAWAMFERAESLRPGAEAALKAKARQLVGGPTSEKIPAGKSAVPYMFETGRADLFVAYCTTGKAAADAGVALTLVELPPALAQTADYGLVVLKGAPRDADRFALFLLSESGQAVLGKWGFAVTTAR
ncbi:molybdate ABC transporter substrate-binding protein [Siculibacillus lacustris]|uniref:Molybdate ABC transporter substrate-binding protein n=1 Tax=Siculibacillus lacustris TaxID=1549641 RepID=A0A4Q9VWN2_9HYPH|nr:molybdate ABC transporter substrate-binding protein [Siculibacillus lacustris]TBW40311.1 molybdate ABC transporter substrate-binding protein [Siculibacillus lacustris]